MVIQSRIPLGYLKQNRIGQSTWFEIEKVIFSASLYNKSIPTKNISLSLKFIRDATEFKELVIELGMFELLYHFLVLKNQYSEKSCHFYFIETYL